MTGNLKRKTSDGDNLVIMFCLFSDHILVIESYSFYRLTNILVIMN